MHVTSEDGIYTFRKSLRKLPKLHERMHFIDSSIVDESEPAVCGIFLMTDPDKVVEVEVEFSDVSCDLGGLLGVSERRGKLYCFKTQIYYVLFHFHF